MGTPVMFASAPTSDGLGWRALRVRENGTIVDEIPGTFESKSASDRNAKRYVGDLK